MTTPEQDEEHIINTSNGSRTVLPTEIAHLMEAQIPNGGSVEGIEEVGVEEEAPVANFPMLP